MATKLSQYTEAVRFLMEAANAIDQAHACLKDAELEDIEITLDDRFRFTRQKHMGVATLSGLVADMAKEVATAECDECTHALRYHHSAEGCEFERGDVPTRCKDGGEVMAAAGPCGCEWGKN